MWIKLRDHLSAKSVYFLGEIQSRLKARRLKHYKNNMRVMLKDFDEDFNEDFNEDLNEDLILCGGARQETPWILLRVP